MNRAEPTGTHDELLAELFDVLKQCEPVKGDERKKIMSAFRVVRERRADAGSPPGERLLRDSVAVAKICAAMKIDADAVSAALLHRAVRGDGSLAELVHHSGSE